VYRTRSPGTWAGHLPAIPAIAELFPPFLDALGWLDISDSRFAGHQCMKLRMERLFEHLLPSAFYRCGVAY